MCEAIFSASAVPVSVEFTVAQLGITRAANIQIGMSQW